MPNAEAFLDAPSSAPAAKPAADALATAARREFGAYEPDHYEYRIAPDGDVRRRTKSAPAKLSAEAFLAEPAKTQGFIERAGKTLAAAGRATVEHPLQAIPGAAEAIAGGAAGLGEAAVTGVSGLARGAYEAARGGKFLHGYQAGAQGAQSLLSPLPLEPETEAGKRYLNVLGLLPEAIHAAGEKVFEKTGSPALAAGTEAAITGATLLLPLKRGRASEATKNLGKAAETARTAEASRATPSGEIRPASAAAPEPAPPSVTNAVDFVRETSKPVHVSAHLEDDLYRLQQQRQADVLRAAQLVKSLPPDATPEVFEKLYHFEENPSVEGPKLTPREREIYAQYVAPLREASNALYAKLKGEDVPAELIAGGEAHTPRFVAGKGGLIERLLAGRAKAVTTGGSLAKSTAALKHRTMIALEDSAGTRRVVSLTAGLKIRPAETLLTDKLKPVQRAMNRYASIEAAYRESSEAAAARPAARRVYARPIGEASEPPLTARRAASEARYYGEQVAAQKARYETADQAQERIGTRTKRAQKRIEELDAKGAALQAKFAPFRGERVYEDAAGKLWRVTQATTREIEAQTPVRYYKNVLANRIIRYLDMRRAQRAIDFQNDLKASPDFQRLAQPIGEGLAPRGWKPTHLAQFRGYIFEPHVADILNRFADRMGREDPAGVLTKVNDFLRVSLFFNPLIHVPNISVHWLVERGATPLVNPRVWARLAKTGMRAIEAVTKQNDDYLRMLDQGAALQYARVVNRDFYKVLLAKMASDLERPKFETIKKALGIVNPYSISNHVTWWVNDVAMMQRYYELIDKGVSAANAINEVEKHIPNYRVPARVLGSRAVSNLITNPNLTMFGPYHYGVLRSYMELAKSLVGRVPIAERASALDKLVMLGLVSLVMYPMLDDLVQHLTENRAAHVRRAGASTVPYNFYLVSQGQKNLRDALLGIVTPAPASLALAELLFNRDMWSGENIYLTRDFNEALQGSPGPFSAEIGRRIAQSVGPLQQGMRISEGYATPGQMLLQMGGVSTVPPHMYREHIRRR